jgi:hypothetical protein
MYAKTNIKRIEERNGVGGLMRFQIIYIPGFYAPPPTRRPSRSPAGPIPPTFQKTEFEKRRDHFLKMGILGEGVRHTKHYANNVNVNNYNKNKVA